MFRNKVSVIYIYIYTYREKWNDNRAKVNRYMDDKQNEREGGLINK